MGITESVIDHGRHDCDCDLGRVSFSFFVVLGHNNNNRQLVQ